jgi:hypothetical protein
MPRTVGPQEEKSEYIFSLSALMTQSGEDQESEEEKATTKAKIVRRESLS